MSETEFDKRGLDQVLAVRSEFGNRWPEGAQAVLLERNPELLTEMTRLENILDSLIQIPVKPKALQKQFKDTLDRYVTITNNCISYASRHIK